MTRTRLLWLISIFAICFATKSTFLAQREKRADGGGIKCYGNNFAGIIENQISCGYLYTFNPTEDCKDATFNAKNNIPGDARLNIREENRLTGPEIYLYCKCDIAECNAKGNFKDCLIQANKQNSVSFTVPNQTHLDSVIKCAMGNISLTFKDFRENYVTTTTTAATTSLSSTAKNEENTPWLYIGLGVSLGILVALIIAISVVAIIVRRNKKKRANGQRTDPESGNTKSIDGTPPNMSVTPAKKSRDKTSKTTEEEIKKKEWDLPKEPPKDTTGILATAKAFIGKGVKIIFNDHETERTNTFENKYPDIEFSILGTQRYRDVEVGMQSYVEMAVPVPFIWKFMEERRRPPQYSANFVDKDRSVIVSEGPGWVTIVDFILLIYYNNTRVVVSSGHENDKGKGKGKFLRFVPVNENETINYHPFTLKTLHKRIVTKHLIICEVEILFTGKDPKKFVWIFLKEWTDYSDEEKAPSVLTAMEYIQTRLSSKISPTSPIIFQCSAGAGRSCSLAMLHIMLTACYSQKEPIDTLPIYSNILCARKGAMHRGRALLFALDQLMQYALKIGVIKSKDLDVWDKQQADLEFMVRVADHELHLGSNTEKSKNDSVNGEP